jgi:hypothetical protein
MKFFLGLKSRHLTLLLFLAGLILISVSFPIWREKFAQKVSISKEAPKDAGTPKLTGKGATQSDEPGVKILDDAGHPRAWETDVDKKYSETLKNTNCGKDLLMNLRFQPSNDGKGISGEWCYPSECYLYRLQETQKGTPDKLGLKCRCRHEWKAKLENEDRERDIYEWTHLTNPSTKELAPFEGNMGDIFYCEKKEKKDDKTYMRWLQLGKCADDAVPNPKLPPVPPIAWKGTEVGNMITPLPYNSPKLTAGDKYDPVINRNKIP